MKLKTFVYTVASIAALVFAFLALGIIMGWSAVS